MASSCPGVNDWEDSPPTTRRTSLGPFRCLSDPSGLQPAKGAAPRHSVPPASAAARKQWIALK